MSSVRSLLATGLIALACLACCIASAQAAPAKVVALGNGANANSLFSFSGDSPNIVTSVPVTGLGASKLAGIDYRPATRELYGLGVSGNETSLFKIQPATGVATLVGSVDFSLLSGATISGATEFGVSFNPASDRLRAIDNLASDGGGGNVNNFRLNPNNGALAGNDSDLNFEALPEGNGNAPLVAVAYAPKALGATSTTLYGIAAGKDRLVIQGGVGGIPSPNGGVLSNVGSLGVNTSTDAGFDVDPASGLAYAALEVGGSSGLYAVDLATGAATLVALIGNGSVDFSGLAIEPPEPAMPPPPSPSSEPTLQALTLAPAAFRATGTAKAKATASTKKAPLGTTVGYTVSAAATVAFSVERKTLGRKVGKKCLKKAAGNADRRPCAIWKILKPGFSKTGAAGAHSFKFNGKLGGKALTPGGYKLAAGVGTTTLRKPFRIVP
jgi:hypothetical protein